MPDRYGETHEPQADTHTDRYRAAQDAQHAITDCRLCDTHGLRNGFPCDHIDHTQAARRGMDMIRETMGWTTP